MNDEKKTNVFDSEQANAVRQTAEAVSQKIDSNVSSAIEGIRNSDQFAKAMENEQVQKVMNSEAAKTVGGFWNKIGKVGRIAVCGVIPLLFLLLISSCFAGNTVTLKANHLIGKIDTAKNCKAGKVYASDLGTTSMAALYFICKDHSKVYLIEGEDGAEYTTTAYESEIFGNKYDAQVNSSDVNGDGVVKYKISVYNGFGYKKLCTVKVKLPKK
ncbi:MAG: hypothetical protein J5851_00505 [Oscillospiraceae bacterium]|nr:hypothetical protein [Oscillospiraceae bacterium]